MALILRGLLVIIFVVEEALFRFDTQMALFKIAAQQFRSISPCYIGSDFEVMILDIFSYVQANLIDGAEYWYSECLLEQ